MKMTGEQTNSKYNLVREVVIESILLEEPVLTQVWEVSELQISQVEKTEHSSRGITAAGVKA